MNDKPATPKLAAALVASLADLCVIEKKHRADAGSYSYDFADLADTVLDTRPVLAKNGVVALTPVHAYGTGLAVTVTFLHESGERMDCDPLPFPAGQNAQATGSMITYHRRYALTAALGMATGEDDDGASAVARQEPPPVVWNAAVAKQHFVKRLGNKSAAAQAWKFLELDQVTEWSQEITEAFVDAWLAEGSGAPDDPTQEGDQ